MPNHPVVGAASSDPHAKRIETEFKGELSCLACHDPHKGRTRQILRWGVTSGAEAAPLSQEVSRAGGGVRRG